MGQSCDQHGPVAVGNPQDFGFRMLTGICYKDDFAGLIVPRERPVGRNPILLMPEEVLHLQFCSTLDVFDRRDVARLLLPYQVGRATRKLC
jgi:hypothetical protein